MASSLFLGIDTGGTFTDGVLLDPENHAIVKTAKMLTTHHNLEICIRQVFEQLLDGEERAIRLVSLSTTLTTNAIVEGKARPVGLFLLGYDPELVYQYGFHQQFNTPNIAFIRGGMDMLGREQAPLDVEAIRQEVDALRGRVEAYAVSSYAGTINGSHEQSAAQVIEQMTGLPVVQGHHLTSRLNSIRRATTACLNAGLLSTAYDFLTTVRSMLDRRGIQCPLVVVKGDGSLVSADFAAHHPVEIIHSGPATSAVGGLYLSKLDSALVVDVGGTTTDLALLHNRQVMMDGGAATVGGYPTSVRTIRSRSFGLGGDSQVRFDPRGQISVGPERVIPLSYLAHENPEVRQDLEQWLESAPEKFYSDRLEYWQLRRAPLQPFTDARTRRVLELLEAGPRRMAWLIKQAGAVSPVQVDAPALLRQDVIARAGLTPTDLLHVTGEYAPWDAQLARRVVEKTAAMLGMGIDDFIHQVREKMTEALVAEILYFMTGQRVPDALTGSNGSLARWAFDQNLNSTDLFLGCRFEMKVPIIGIGAPARSFLPPVASALGTQVHFPTHYEVANAVGTVVSSVMVRREGEVLPLLNGPVVVGYAARAGGVQATCETMEEALAFARQTLLEQVRAGAEAAGAQDPGLELIEQELIGGMVSIVAQAVGSPRL